MLDLLRRALRRTGFDLVRYHPVAPQLRRRADLLHRLAIDVVLDVGANSGIYARELRGIGYRGRIVSFEPLSAAYGALSASASGDPLWSTVNLAVGAAAGSAALHVAANSWSSSLRPMAATHLAVAPDSRYVAEERVEVTTLDAVFDRHVRAGERAWLKIDTQGHERDVLLGAADSLARVDLVQVEMQLVELYEGETLFHGLYAMLAERGFACVHLEPGLLDPRDERLLSLDGYFRRLPAA